MDVFARQFLNDTVDILHQVSVADIEAVAAELAATRSRGGRLSSSAPAEERVTRHTLHATSESSRRSSRTVSATMCQSSRPGSMTKVGTPRIRNGYERRV